MPNKNIIATSEYKTLPEYEKQLKENLMEAIGKAQAVMLLKPTPKGEKRKRLMNPSRPRGAGNPEFTYVEHAYVSETLDLALLMDWDLVVTKSERIGEEAFVEGYIEARFKNGMKIKRSGYGGAKKVNNPNQSWGDVFKAATSDLLKNCASRMGVARDLYRTEEKNTEVAFKDTPALPTEEIQKLDGDKPALPAQLNAIATLKGISPNQLTEEETRLSFSEASAKIKELSVKK